MPIHSSFILLLPNWALRLFCLGNGATKDECAWLRKILKEVPGKIISHRLKLISQVKVVGPLDIQCPSYYLQASGDRLVPKHASDWFVYNIKGLKLISIEAPHFMLQSKPFECAADIAKLI